LKDIVINLEKYYIGSTVPVQPINNSELSKINHCIRNHPIEIIGYKLRKYMKEMKSITITQ
ncbi:ketol-acid reductoisomerase, partial [Buchnera aphidicola]|nr:ketol-acid reductoisomerase [Buchnera aphidicola]